ncbi:hypothetical protein ACS5PN_03905 [Roseateles sp. NT4]|uniref:hypothetical protein n=1 Tax=Roseateles sp. NT4 TaxID=3453715 RepID=UPI003EF031E8
MHNRTQNALNLQAALYRELRRLQDAAKVTGAGELGQVGRERLAANDIPSPPPKVLTTRPAWKDLDQARRG